MNFSAEIVMADLKLWFEVKTFPAVHTAIAKT